MKKNANSFLLHGCTNITKRKQRRRVVEKRGKLFSFQKHLTSDKVTIMKLLCCVSKAATWIWLVFFVADLHKKSASENSFSHSLSPARRPYYESLPRSEQLLIEKHFQTFASAFRLGGKFFPSTPMH